MMYKKCFLVFLIVFFSQMKAQAYLVDDDKEYFVNEFPSFKLIYPAEFENLTSKTRKMYEFIDEDYKNSFLWKLNEKNTVVLASDNNQVPNAFATVFLGNLNVYYNGGASLIDYFSNQSWLFSLLSHEGAHLYQLDPSREIGRFYSKIFRASPIPHFLIILPIFTHPNYLLPNFLIEGNAVFNESRFGNGGRLYSGELRALFYSLVKDKKLGATRLTNNHIKFPYMQEKYIVGGYFFNYLAKKYSVQKANSIFKRQAYHYMWPFIVNSTFEDHFGKGYYELIDDFLSYYEPIAMKQQSLDENKFAYSLYHNSMNSDDSEIWFLVTNGKTLPKLCIINKKSNEINYKELNLPYGKVFKSKDGEYYSSSSGLVSKKKINFSLWSDKEVDLMEYRSKIVSDIRDGDVLWLNPKESLHYPILYKNNKRLGITNSFALMDHEKNVYRFIQKNKNRILYKNDQELFLYRSYNGKLLEIGNDGSIYFIAPSEYGSSLFSWVDGKIFRLSRSDTIIDGRMLNSNSFVVTEVSSEGFLHKIININKREENPYEIRYFFENDKSFDLFSNFKNNENNKDDDNNKEDENNNKVDVLKRSYNMIRDIKYAGTQTSLLLGENGINFNISSLLIDSLGFNDLSLTGSKGANFGHDYLNVRYAYRKYLIDFMFLYNLDKKYPTKSNKNRRKEYEENLFAGIKWPLIMTENRKLSFSQYAGYERREEEWITYSSFEYFYYDFFGLSYRPYRSYAALVEYEREEDNEYLASTWGRGTFLFGDEFYLSLGGLFKITNDYELLLSAPISGNSSSSGKHSIYSYLGKDLIGGNIGVELMKAFETGLYFSIFPISLRRIAPKLMVHNFYYKVFKTHTFLEYGAGLEIELLLFHLAPLQLSINYFTKEFQEEQFELGLSSFLRF